MTTNTPNNVRNYFKLELLVARSNVILRQLFKNRHFLFNTGKVWDDSAICGSNYVVNVVAKNKQINLTAVQRTAVSNGDSNEWDLTTLTALLLNTERPKTLNKTQIQQLDDEDKLLKQLRDIRNKLAHHSTKSIDDSEFNQLWTDLTAILVTFGDDNNELDKMKDDRVFESSTKSINEDNVNEAKRLNSLGTQAHKDKNFSDAITLFTKATVLPGVSDHDRAVFFSNMSSSRLASYEQQSNLPRKFEIDGPTDQRYRALQDAKQSRNLWPTWWKGHFRVGKVYAILNEHEKAITSFERAFALDCTNDEIRKALDESRMILGRQNRQEHLDPRLKPATMHEQLNEMKQKLGTNPEDVRMSHNLLPRLDPAAADVVKGHQYEHGDIDVKQDYEQAAKYFSKAANQDNAEGMYNLARLTDLGLGVKKDHDLAFKLLQQAASQPVQHPIYKGEPNEGVVAAEHALGLRYDEGVTIPKNLATAAYWYQRATGNGCAESANNLALMYLDGTGVDQDINKAEQLLELSARGGDINAMLTLGEHLLNKNDPEMAKIWFDRACESGNIVAQANRGQFEKVLKEKQQLIKHSPSNMLQALNVFNDTIASLKTTNSVYKQSNQPDVYDQEALKEYVNRGSITAKKLCDALEHFFQALNILKQPTILTEKQEDQFVHELSQCYRIEHIVARFPELNMREKAEKIVDRVLHRCSKISETINSQLDEDTRLCYSVLHLDSRQLIAQFLVVCKQRYPKSIHFFEFSAVINGWLARYEDTLYDANIGLEIDPNYTELLYYKAVALRLLSKDMDEANKAYKTFLAHAPEDHRKVPESYYAMGACFLVSHEHDHVSDFVETTFRQGLEAEKLQLPCFMPYDSNSKILLQGMLNVKQLPNTQLASNPSRKSRLDGLHRIDVIKRHRAWECKMLNQKNNPTSCFMSYTHLPRVKQATVKSLIGLKSISLREINPIKDHVYEGYVLSVTIIEEAWSWTPTIHLVIEDEHLDCERMFIYDFLKEQGEHLTRQVFTIGSKIHIINPYLRLGASDKKPFIRIDDFSSIIMQNESEQVINMCRCCGEANALHVCSRCKQARYCSKECQIMDWKVYEHKLICSKH